MSSFRQLVIISTKYILNNVGERGQTWHTPVLILASFGNMELSFTNILFCVCMSTTACHNVSEISDMCLCILSNAFS